MLKLTQRIGLSLLLMTTTRNADDVVLKAPDSAEVTASGLAHQLIKKGSSDAKPGPTDMVVVHYAGWTSNGNKFDDSRSRGQPVTFPLDRVIKGWSEGVQLMSVGEKRRFWVPQALAYGNNPKLGAPRGDLVFDIELLAIKKPQPAPEVPANLSAPPKEATLDPSGMVSLVLQEGTGKVNPKGSSVVRVHYTGWDKNGKMVDSSIVRDEPLIAPLNRVIRGWSIGVQLMTVGEKRRFWIPPKLAYGSNPPNGAPVGPLVFDIELLEIINL